MRQPYRFFRMLLFAALLSACTGVRGTPASAQVEDQASLLQALRDGGATVKEGEPVQQEFFGPEGRILGVNDAGIQVFEYPSAEAMEQDAAKVAADGGSIGTTMVNWMDAPHFYKTGRILVLYVGSDATVMSLLQKAMGAQFAGR